MSAYEQLRLLQAVCFICAGMLFFMTLLYIAATPDADEPRPKDWYKPWGGDAICPLHKKPRSKCSPESHDDDRR